MKNSDGKKQVSHMNTSWLQEEQGKKIQKFTGDVNTFIEQCRSCLESVLNKLDLENKAILIFDSKGVLLDILASSAISQWFFRRGFYIGEEAESKLNFLGKGQIEDANLYFDKYKKYELDFWTVISGEIVANHHILGYIRIFIDIKDNSNHCFLVMELIVKYLSVILENQLYGNNKMDKILFFGYFSLNDKYRLTPKEVEILYLIYLGHTPSDLPEKLGVSINTIKTHMKNIYSKFSVKRLSECLSKVDNILGEIT